MTHESVIGVAGLIHPCVLWVDVIQHHCVHLRGQRRHHKQPHVTSNLIVGLLRDWIFIMTSPSITNHVGSIAWALPTNLAYSGWHLK